MSACMTEANGKQQFQVPQYIVVKNKEGTGENS